MNPISSMILWISLALYLSSYTTDFLWGRVSSLANTTPDAAIGVIHPDWLGTWNEVVDTTQQYFANSEHRITFLANDSFNIKIHNFTDATTPDDPCGFQWTHYAAGKVVNEDPLITQAASRSPDDVLLFRGSFTDSSYTQPAPNCQGEETFDRLVSVSQPHADTLTVTFYHTDSGETWETEVNLVGVKE